MTLSLTAADRLLVLAPHPDDESLACAGLIQRTLAAGGEVAVVIATNGDANPWPQRLVERRLRLGPDASRRWGARRQQEARDALPLLGVDPAQVHFLHWPDQGLTARMDEPSAVESLREVLRAVRPTLVAAPTLQDSHPDHSALALLLRAALHGSSLAPRVLGYWLHGRASEPPPSSVLRLSRDELARKQAAVLAHWTQVQLGRARLLAYVRHEEEFFEDHAPIAPATAPTWRWRFAAGRVAALGFRRLRIAAMTHSGALRTVTLDLRDRHEAPDLLIRRAGRDTVQVVMSPLWPDVAWTCAKLDHLHRVYVYDTCAWRHASAEGDRVDIAAPALPRLARPSPAPASFPGKDGESPLAYRGGHPSPAGPDMRPWTILCDFDGTICLPDATDMLLERLAHPAWKTVERDWRCGRIGSRECMTRQVAMIDASDEELDAALDDVQMDPAFPAFVAQARAFGVELAVVSDGLDRAIRTVLRRHGLDALPVVANRFQRSGMRRWRLESPHADATCLAGSGTCKCAWAARSRAAAGDARILLIGDGQSDVCVAGRADFVFAKDRLLAHCRDAGIAHRPIAGFDDALALLPDLIAGRLTPAAPPPVPAQAEPA